MKTYRSQLDDKDVVYLKKVHNMIHKSFNNDICNNVLGEKVEGRCIYSCSLNGGGQQLISGRPRKLGLLQH
jgi:hypothetical protein